MKSVRVLLLVLAAVFAQTPSALSNDLAKGFVQGIQAYDKGDFDQAIDRFEAIAKSGVRNGSLYYNLGNAYMKKGDLGRAVLWYERAAQLIPKDPDLKFNRDYAASLVQDAPEEKGAGFFKVIFFWYFILDPRTIRWAAVILNAIFWAIIAWRTFRQKRLFSPVAGTVLALSLVFALTAGYQYWQDRYVNYAVVLPDQVSVRSGFSQGATELFVLHAGTRLRIDQERKEGYRIRFSDQKIGWLRRGEVEPVGVRFEAEGRR